MTTVAYNVTNSILHGTREKTHKTHKHLPNLICNDSCIEQQLYQRFIRFTGSCLRSSYHAVKLWAKLSVNGSQSNVLFLKCYL